MSQNLAQLCALLIEDTYGPLYSLIFSTLTTHGRLSARDISQKCLLPPKQVFSGLAVLTECLFVYHHSAPDGRTSYQANQTAAFNLVRVGRFTRLMRREFGPDGVDVLKHLLIFGHDTGDNLQKLSTPIKEQERPNGVDEDAIDLNDPETEQSESMRRVLERLVQQKYLIELRPAHFQTWTDTWRAAELVVKASGSLSLAKGKKGQQELEEAVQEEMDRILSGDVTTNGKRAAADESDAPAAKKLKRANGEQRNGVPAPERLSPLHGGSSYRLNLDKLLLVLQHQAFSDRVRRQMGNQTGDVLTALLHQCETPKLTGGNAQQPALADRRSGEARLQILDLDQALHDVNESDTSGGFHQGVVNGHANGSSSRRDEIEMEELEEQVATLAEGSCDFISHTGANNEKIWSVDLGGVEDRSRNDEIMQMVKQRFGLMSLRIIRILMSRGKVDEKALQEIGLLNAKDLRRCLAQLHAHGFIDLQEVPREPQRQPARTIYLWFYDGDRVKMRIMENLYKSMCRLLQRLKVERLKVSSTLQKAERSDVKGKEHEMLRSDEITVLKQWRRKELWYLSELERLGSSVDLCAWK